MSTGRPREYVLTVSCPDAVGRPYQQAFDAGGKQAASTRVRSDAGTIGP